MKNVNDHHFFLTKTEESSNIQYVNVLLLFLIFRIRAIELQDML